MKCNLDSFKINFLKEQELGQKLHDQTSLILDSINGGLLDQSLALDFESNNEGQKEAIKKIDKSSDLLDEKSEEKQEEPPKRIKLENTLSELIHNYENFDKIQAKSELIEAFNVNLYFLTSRN